MRTCIGPAPVLSLYQSRSYLGTRLGQGGNDRAERQHESAWFYKRGCQEKTLPRPQEGCIFLTSSPLPVAADAVHTSTVSLSDVCSHHCWSLPARYPGACKQSVGYGPTMVLSETRGLLLDWVVRGGIRSLERLEAYTRGWILTLEPEHSCTSGRRIMMSAIRRHSVLKLLATSDIWRRTFLLPSRS